MPNRLGLRDAVEGDGRSQCVAVGGDAAAADGHVHGDGGGAGSSGEIPRICEAGQVREEEAATGLAGQEAKGLASAGMQFLHIAGRSSGSRVMSTPLLGSKENRKDMDEGYGLLIELANRYVKNEGPPVQPPAWLQPPVPQNGDIAQLAPRRRRVRTAGGHVGLRGAQVGQRGLEIKTAGAAV